MDEIFKSLLSVLHELPKTVSSFVEVPGSTSVCEHRFAEKEPPKIRNEFQFVGRFMPSPRCKGNLVYIVTSQRYHRFIVYYTQCLLASAGGKAIELWLQVLLNFFPARTKLYSS